MSFGRPANSPPDNEEFVAYMQNMNSKVASLEELLSNLTQKNNSYLERIEKSIEERNKPEDLVGINETLSEIQGRIERIEASKGKQEVILEEYIQRLESLNFSKSNTESSFRESRRLRPEKRAEKDSAEIKGNHSFENTENSMEHPRDSKLIDIEQKLQRFEQETIERNEFRQNMKDAIKRIGKIEKWMINNKSFGEEGLVEEDSLREGFRLPGANESAVIAAVMEKSKYSRLNGSLLQCRKPLMSSGSCKRGPSSELKKCLQSKGFEINENRPVYRKTR